LCLPDDPYFFLKLADAAGKSATIDKAVAVATPTQLHYGDPGAEKAGRRQ
jgi:hypothetical protein